MEDNDYVFHYKEDTLLLKNNNSVLELPVKKDFAEISDSTAYTFLFTFNDVSCFLVWDELNADKPSFEYTKVHLYRSTKQMELAWICMVGYHLKNWYAHSQYCGKCGSKTNHKSDERAMICPSCGWVEYPRISPAIIVALVCKDKILLVNNSNAPSSRYTLVSGFVDVGETLEETLIREVKEEVGLDVKNIRYFKSQPWAISGTLMVGFVAETDDQQPIVLEENELGVAKWFTRGNLPEHSLSLSISGELIEAFEMGKI